jgi:multisubunit Na+/H+ antiporter MnhE subunit
MKIAREVYSEVGKAFVNAGLGFAFAIVIAWLFTKDPVAWWKLLLGIITGLAQVFIGAAFIQVAHYVSKKEDKTNG